MLPGVAMPTTRIGYCDGKHTAIKHVCALSPTSLGVPHMRVSIRIVNRGQLQFYHHFNPK